MLIFKFKVNPENSLNLTLKIHVLQYVCIKFNIIDLNFNFCVDFHIILEIIDTHYRYKFF